MVNHPALIITRPVEWGTVIFGYEQVGRGCVKQGSEGQHHLPAPVALDLDLDLLGLAAGQLALFLGPGGARFGAAGLWSVRTGLPSGDEFGDVGTD